MHVGFLRTIHVVKRTALYLICAIAIIMMSGASARGAEGAAILWLNWDSSVGPVKLDLETRVKGSSTQSNWYEWGESIGSYSPYDLGIADSEPGVYQWRVQVYYSSPAQQSINLPISFVVEDETGTLTSGSFSVKTDPNKFVDGAIISCVRGCPILVRPTHGPAHPASDSVDPVSYVNGSVSYFRSDLVSGSDKHFGQTRSYSNNPASLGVDPDNTQFLTPSPLGPGWYINQLPFIVAEDGEAVVHFGAPDRAFDLVEGSGYYDSTGLMLPRAINENDGEDTLTETDDSAYTYKDSEGNQIYFLPRGNFVLFDHSIDQYGNIIQATYSEQNQLEMVTRTLANGAVEEYVYQYDSTWGQISEIQHLFVTGGISTLVEQVGYEYAAATSQVNPPGYLERVTIEDTSGAIKSQEYYRYWTGADYLVAQPLKYIVEPRNYAQMVGSGIDPMTANDSIVANYANHYFEYSNDFNNSVSKHIVQSSGPEGNGTYTYAFTYLNQSAPEVDTNASNWVTKCTETLPDGNSNIIYSNSIGNVLLKTTFNQTTKSYLNTTYYTYDLHGRLQQHVYASAIASYDDSLHYEAGNLAAVSDLDVTLVASGGKVESQTYDDVDFAVDRCADLIASTTITDASGSFVIPASSITYTAANGVTNSLEWIGDIPQGTWSADNGQGQLALQFGISSAAPVSGSLVHISPTTIGLHGHLFTWATTPLNPKSGDTFYTYVWMDPAAPPTELMLEFFDDSGWEHRAYWGANATVGWGTNGTPSLFPEGALPPLGTWVRLNVNADDVGISGKTISGVAYLAVNGQQAWDDSGISEGGIDTPWVDDALPVGATPSIYRESEPSWMWANQCPSSLPDGKLCIDLPPSAGYHDEYVMGYSAVTPAPSQTLSTWIYLDPHNPPSEIALKIATNANGRNQWTSRIFWGPNLISDSTAQYSGGNLPPVGQWVYLSVPVASIGLSNTNMIGVSFEAVDGQAWFDHVLVNTLSAVAPYLVASKTEYRDQSTSGAITTNFAYTFYPGSVGIASATTIFPAIGINENGSGQSVSATDILDQRGNITWHMDENNVLTYQAFDPYTDAVITRIQDVNTNNTNDFANLPIGWHTPMGGGLHLITRLTNDAFGRPIRIDDAAGSTSFMIYDDVGHAIRTYEGWNAATQTTTTPTRLYREDWANGYNEWLTMRQQPSVAGGVPTGQEPIANLASLTRILVDVGGRSIAQDTYFNLHGLTYANTPSIGSLGTNYYQKTFGYDARNNLCREVNEVGTIRRSVYDAINRPIGHWIGTNDSPSNGLWSAQNNTAPCNMIEAEDRAYDSDSDLVTRTQHPTGNPNDDRVDEFWYDFADRQVAFKKGVQTSEVGGVGRLLTIQTLDDRGCPTATTVYTADGVTPVAANGSWTAPSGVQAVSYSTSAYDERGRCYTTTAYPVDPASGSIALSGLTTYSWFDPRGHRIKSSVPNSCTTKDRYDGCGRVVLESTTDTGGDTTYADAFTESKNTVLTQKSYTYDGVGHVLIVTTKDRFDTETAFGDLNGPVQPPLARVSYRQQFYDADHRLIASADVGTNGGNPFTPFASMPASTSTCLVTDIAYNDAGYPSLKTDPNGVVTKICYDARGMAVATIENYLPSVNGGQPTNSANRTTVMSLDGIGHQTSVTAVMPTGGVNQTTAYTYQASPGTGSMLYSNDLLTQIALPDKTAGVASSHSADQQSIGYNILGQKISMTDGNGTTHAYLYDVLGRRVMDEITTLGAGVDGTVQALGIAYNLQGLPYAYTSYTAGYTSVVNQVMRAFNGLEQPLIEWQSISGPVNTGTTPAVQWRYVGVTDGSNRSQLNAIVYPNGRILHIVRTGLDANINRVTSLADDDGLGGVGTVLESYRYLGLRTIVNRQRPEPNVTQSVIAQSGETGDAGDSYVGLDRFGRIVDLRWTGPGGTDLDHWQHAYDQDSRPLYTNNLVAPTFSELYQINGASPTTAYDGLGRLQAFSRGVLSASGQNGAGLDTVAVPNDPTGGSGPISAQQAWALDPLGNWVSLETNGQANTGAFNAQNEQISNAQSLFSYDNNGNYLGATDR